MSESETFLHALSALRIGRAAEAERLFKELLKAEPRHVAGLNLLAVLMTKAERFVEAESYIRRALDENSSSDVSFYNYGIILKALNRPDEALGQLGHALRINPAIPQTWNMRGMILNEMRRHNEAIADFDKAISLDASFADAYCNKAGALAELRQYIPALDSYAKALSLKPDLVPAWLGRASIHFELKQYDDAIACYDHALEIRPNLLAALLARGDIYLVLGQYDRASAAYDRALTVKPDLAEAWLGRGNVHIELKQYEKGLAAYEQALRAKSNFAEAWFGCGRVFTQLKQYGNALEAYRRALDAKPDLANAWIGFGYANAEFKRYDEAFSAYDRALTLDPDLAEAWLGLGNTKIKLKLKRFDDALTAYDRALNIKPELAEGWLGRGNIYFEFKNFSRAVAAYDHALSIKPDLAAAWLGLGNVHLALKQLDDASRAYDRALQFAHDMAEAWLGHGNIYAELRQYGDALIAYDRALALRPDLIEAWLGRAHACSELQRYEDAFAAYDQALNLEPELASIWYGYGKLHFALGQYDKAFAAYDRAVNLANDLSYAAGSRLFAKMNICDWTNIDAETRSLLAAVHNRVPTDPFTLFPVSSTSADQLQCAKTFAAEHGSFPSLWNGESYSHDRIRIVYLSADFHDHATAFLSAGLFDLHDKSRFEVTAISCGTILQSEMRRRISSAVEHFIDARQSSDREIAEVIRSREVDIVVDLKGFTGGGRFNVLARRPAPIQVNYLGFPSTMGADCIDYIIADNTIIPEEHFPFFSERVVWLPNSYQVNDRRRRIADQSLTRKECGLPDNAFVFCCFNNSYKIVPEVFEVWMRLLHARADSVLWLLEGHPVATANLRREAEARGIRAERLIFAPRIPMPDHLARHQHADLFLDTIPCNAHTTASDALWAEVPVLTCLGATFAGRVAGSLLNAIGLEDLIARSLQEYEALALKLAQTPSNLAALKQKLAQNRLTHPLFDTERFVHHIERAFLIMWERHQMGEPPQAFVVPPGL
jgi:predicted O-linked N-acetylglucosamine transferase (SPINDLY family)